jgi:leader peptidase (prepilin peptidase) / N-methyltransferase
MIWIAGVLGLVFGSFANVVAYRVPRDMSIARPPSACTNCNTPINPMDNIPVLSWLLLRGRCRACGERFSARYPVVELATGVLFALMAYRIGVNWLLPGFLVFSLVTMILVLTDLDWKRIPNAILFPGGAIAAGLLAVGAFLEGTPAHLGRAALAGLIYFGILFLMAILTRGGMGMGDVKLVALLGFFGGYLSWAVFIASAISGFIIGGMVGLVLLITGRKGRKDEVPFGPPLIFGSWLAILGQPWVAEWLPRFSG